MKYKKIVDLEQYTEYCKRHEELVISNYDKHVDEIELLEILIEEFDNRNRSYRKELDPVQLLESFLKEEEISKSQLAKELGSSRQLINDILSYRRNISKRMVTKLSAYFKLRPEAFSRPYKLKNYKRQEKVSA